MNNNQGPSQSAATYSARPMCDQLGLMFKTWFDTLGIGCVGMALILTLTFVPGWIALMMSTARPFVCLTPANFLDWRVLFSFWTPLVYPFVHYNPFHLLFNLFALLFITSNVERITGTLHVLFTMLISVVLTAIIVVLTGWAMYFVPYVGQYMFNSCNVGLSGYLMFTSLIMLICLTNMKTLLCCCCLPVPSHLYVWIMFAVIVIIDIVSFTGPFSVSWAGYLAGIIVGYLYFFGPMRWIIPNKLFMAIESKIPLEKLPHYFPARKLPKRGPVEEFRDLTNASQTDRPVMGMSLFGRSAQVTETAPGTRETQFNPRAATAPNRGGGQSQSQGQGQGSFTGRGRTLGRWARQSGQGQRGPDSFPPIPPNP